jgi:hypothetical protein
MGFLAAPLGRHADPGWVGDGFTERVRCWQWTRTHRTTHTRFRKSAI